MSRIAVRAPLLGAASGVTLALALTLALAPGCSKRSPPPPSTAEPLSIFSPSLPDDFNEQARMALAADAYRRESRFADAIDPGFLFRSTRVPQDEIDLGKWTGPKLFELGAELFHVTFEARDGYGAKDLPRIARFHKGRRGGPDAYTCASCHWRGGPSGAGDGADNAYLDGDGDAQSTALARNPIGLSGVGVIELLAREMTTELLKQRDALVDAARSRDKALRTDLHAKGMSFGKLGAAPDGTLDTSAIVGVDADLVVKPFGWKGSFASLRDVIEDELLTHHGMESEHLVSTAPPERIGPFGGKDPDGDGVTDEITEGQVTALVAYLAMQEAPIIEMPARQNMLPEWSKGREVFHSLGCASCHVPSMTLDRAVYEIPSRAGGRALSIDLEKEGAEPRIQRATSGGFEVWLFSDLKRHEMGSRLAEARPDRGVPGATFMTPPLWGIARTRPYLHDASAATLEEAILAHGGEAEAAREGFAALSDAGRYPLRLYLSTLTRAPRMVSP